MKIDDESVKEIEAVLGRTFDPSKLVRYESLNDIPASLIEETHRLPERLWYQYLGCFIPDHAQRYYMLFFQHVVQEGYDPEWWMVSTNFFSRFTSDVLEKDILDELRNFQSAGDTGWYFLPLTTWDWQLNEHGTGAPIVVNFTNRKYNYRNRKPRNISSYGPPTSENLQRYDGDVRILLRRWFASIIARKAAEYTHKGPNRRPADDFSELYHHVKAFFETRREPNKIISELFPEVQNPSEDTLQAIEGLLLEIDDGDYSNNQIPGYVGPDIYYAKTASKQTIPTAEQFPVEAPSFERIITSIDQARTRAAELLMVPKETFADSAQDFPDIEAYYLWENVRGGRALVVGYDGTVLFANSSVRPSDHRQAYANGRRTAAEAFEQGRQ